MHLICIILHFPHLMSPRPDSRRCALSGVLSFRAFWGVSHFAVRQLKSKASPQPTLHLRSFLIISILSVFRSPPRNRPRVRRNRDDFPIFNSLLPGDKQCQRPWLVLVVNWHMHSNAQYRRVAPVAECRRRRCQNETKTAQAKPHNYIFIISFSFLWCVSSRRDSIYTHKKPTYVFLWLLSAPTNFPFETANKQTQKKRPKREGMERSVVGIFRAIFARNINIASRVNCSRWPVAT